MPFCLYVNLKNLWFIKKQKKKHQQPQTKDFFFFYCFHILKNIMDIFVFSGLLLYLPYKYLIIHKPLIRTWKDHFISYTTFCALFPKASIDFFFNANNLKGFNFSCCKAITFS